MDRSQKRRLGSSIAAALTCALLPLRAPAEPNDPSRDELPLHEAPPVVVDAVQPGEPSEDPSSFTTVIELDDRPGEPQSIEQLLSDSVGVQVRRFGGPGDPAELSIRGSTASQVVILLDGVRVNSAQSGAVDLATLPASLIERIEVSRGGGSAQTGSDAIGGVVNLVTRRPEGPPRTTLAFSGGSFDTYRGSFAHTGLHDDVEVSLGYEGFGTDGDWRFRPADRDLDGTTIPAPGGAFTRINNDRQSHAALLRFGGSPSPRTHLSFSDSFFHDAGGRPGTDAGSGENLGQSPSARQRRLRNLAQLRLEGTELGPLALDGDLALFHRYDRSRFRDASPGFGAAVDSDNRNHGAGTRLGFGRRLAAAGVEQRPWLAAELRYDLLRSRDFPSRERRTVGVFLQDEIRLLEARVRVIPALRLDATEGFDSEWLPRFGLLITPVPWLRLRGNVERTYRVPNFDELFFDEEFVRGNPALRPERALEFDAGFELIFARLGPAESLTLEFAAFQREIDESIVFQLVSPFVVAATNIGKARVRGLELAGGFELLSWLRANANWTRLDTRDDSTGNPIPGRAEHEVFARLEVGPPSRLLRLWVASRYTDEIPVTADGGTTVSARTVVDVGAVLALHRLSLLDALPFEGLFASVSVHNVGDRSVRDAQFFPQPGRQLDLRLEASW